MQSTEHPAQRANAPTAPPKPLLTITEFYREFQGAIGINAIRTAVNNGRIKSIAVGERKRLIPVSEIHDWPTRETEHQA